MINAKGIKHKYKKGSVGINGQGSKINSILRTQYIIKEGEGESERERKREAERDRETERESTFKSTQARMKLVRNLHEIKHSQH